MQRSAMPIVVYGDAASQARATAAHARALPALVAACEVGDAKQCAAASSETLAAAVARAHVLATRGCKAGDAAACSLVACHGGNQAYGDAWPWGERFGSSAASLCGAACELGDFASCFVLAKLDSMGAVEMDLGAAGVKRALKHASDCASAAACVAAGDKAAEASRPDEYTFDWLADFESAAAHLRGCELGSAVACERVVEHVNAASTPALAKKGCAAGLASLCQVSEKAARLLGMNAFTSACKAGRHPRVAARRAISRPAPTPTSSSPRRKIGMSKARLTIAPSVAVRSELTSASARWQSA